MSVAQEIARRVEARWPDARVRIVDESHKHAGHAGASAAGESHFHLSIAAAAFAAMSRVERHRAVNDALADLLKGPVHALRLTLTTPEP